MMLLREFPKRRLQFFLVRTSADAQHLIVVAFCHSDLAPEPEFGPTCSESAGGTRTVFYADFLSSSLTSVKSASTTSSFPSPPPASEPLASPPPVPCCWPL